LPVGIDPCCPHLERSSVWSEVRVASGNRSPVGVDADCEHRKLI
jgi:hypothetical protein